MDLYADDIRERLFVEVYNAGKIWCWYTDCPAMMSG